MLAVTVLKFLVRVIQRCTTPVQRLWSGSFVGLAVVPYFAAHLAWRVFDCFCTVLLYGSGSFVGLSGLSYVFLRADVFHRSFDYYFAVEAPSRLQLSSCVLHGI